MCLTFAMMAGVIRYYYCEGEWHILFHNGHIAMDSDCCCCPRCTDYETPFGPMCDNASGVPPPWVTVTFNRADDVDCSDCETYFLGQSFELQCHDTQGCYYLLAIPGGSSACYYDLIEYFIMQSLGGSVKGSVVRVRDNEPSPDQWTIFQKSQTYPIDCDATQVIDFFSQSDDNCDFDGGANEDGTATVVPHCEAPT